MHSAAHDENNHGGLNERDCSESGRTGLLSGWSLGILLDSRVIGRDRMTAALSKPLLRREEGTRAAERWGLPADLPQRADACCRPPRGHRSPAAGRFALFSSSAVTSPDKIAMPGGIDTVLI